jgi:hypothetical protein
VTEITNVGVEVDLKLRQGADFATTLTFTNADGSVVDLTGCMLAAQIRRRPRDNAPAVASFALSIASPATLGTASMSMSAATTARIVCGDSIDDDASKYVWDLELTDANGLVSSPLHGKLYLFREVTR